MSNNISFTVASIATVVSTAGLFYAAVQQEANEPQVASLPEWSNTTTSTSTPTQSSPESFFTNDMQVEGCYGFSDMGGNSPKSNNCF